MIHVEIYTTPFCPYCLRAKALLTKKGVAFHEVDVSEIPGARAEMQQRTDGARTVPQIFIGGKLIGGSDELVALERKGELDALLAVAE